MMDGIFVIHKAIGMTSHDVVGKVRKLIHQKRVGHAGTLDPAASGVLPICVGQGTRVAEYLSESGKAYSATITFGIVTDTYDSEGTILEENDPSAVTLEAIQTILPNFLGPQLQMPPRYSAIKIAGQAAYKRVRAGEEVHLEGRPIEIYRLEVTAWNPPTLTLEVECSKGTYIRSLAYDLGRQLGCGAYLAGLVRTRSGPFTLAEGVTLEQLAQAAAENTLESYLQPADKALAHCPAIWLDEEQALRVKHGNSFQVELQGAPDQLARVYDLSGNFIAIAEWSEDQRAWLPKKVLAVL